MIDLRRCVPLGFRGVRCRLALVCSANAGPRDNTGAPAFPSTPRRDAAAASRYHADSAADSGPATGGFSCRCSPLGFVGMTTQTNADEHPGVCPGCGASVAGHRPSPPAGVVSARGSDGDDGGHCLYDTTRVTRKSDLARSPISFEHVLWTPIWRRVAGETDGVLNRSLLVTYECRPYRHLQAAGYGMPSPVL